MSWTSHVTRENQKGSEAEMAQGGSPLCNDFSITEKNEKHTFSFPHSLGEERRIELCFMTLRALKKESQTSWFRLGHMTLNKTQRLIMEGCLSPRKDSWPLTRKEGGECRR